MHPSFPRAVNPRPVRPQVETSSILMVVKYKDLYINGIDSVVFNWAY
jgi:hypothetical protein